MTLNFLRPIRTLFLLLFAATLAACQTAPAPTGFTSAQIAALETEGFVETGMGWELTFNERLLFPSNESVVHAELTARIESLARNLVSVGILTAQVEGHSDSTGAAAYNLSLSQARAQSVATSLQAGGMRFTADQIIGRGETVPMSSNATVEGRQDNRRVVVIVTSQ